MKKLFLLITVLVFSFQFANAQYGGGGYGGGGYGVGGYGGGGLDRRIGGANSAPQTPSKPKLEDVSKRVNAIVDKMKIDLTLDELQVFAVKKYITDNQNATDKVILKEGATDDEKIESINQINNTSDFNIIAILNKVQKEKYKTMVEERKAKIEAYQQNRR